MKNPNMRRNTIPPSRKGIPHSEETKRRIAETCRQKGIGKWMKGRILSEETRKKQSENSAKHWLGKIRGPQSEETIKKRSEALKGHAVSEETRIRISQLNRGRFEKEHPCWKEVKKSPLYKSIRDTRKYREWRSNIFQRDKFTCVNCFQLGGVLHADHFPVTFFNLVKQAGITSLKEAVSCDKLWSAEGRTLCVSCHRKTDTWGRRKI